MAENYDFQLCVEDNPHDVGTAYLSTSEKFIYHKLYSIKTDTAFGD